MQAQILGRYLRDGLEILKEEVIRGVLGLEGISNLVLPSDESDFDFFSNPNSIFLKLLREGRLWEQLIF